MHPGPAAKEAFYKTFISAAEESFFLDISSLVPCYQTSVTMGRGRGIQLPIWILILAASCIQQNAHAQDDAQAAQETDYSESYSFSESDNDNGQTGSYELMSTSSTKKTSRPLVTAHNDQVCSTWGNFNYKTFDGNIFHHPGTCNYLFASNCKSPNEDFNIQIRRTMVNNIPKFSHIILKIEGEVFEFVDDKVMVDGEEADLPYNHAGVQIDRNGLYLRLSSKIGLDFTWNEEDSIMLELDHIFANTTCGLCGDYNEDPKNEFFKNGEEMTPLQYGNLQKMNGPTEVCEDIITEPLNSCTDEHKTCTEILNGTAFSECQESVDSLQYIERCVQDLCLCNTIEFQSFCLCNTFAEYSRQCAHSGKEPQNWRRPDLCPITCPHNMLYAECGLPCVDTCSNNELSAVCDHHCSDGCFCPEGTVYDDITHTGCIKQTECPCTFNHNTYEIGTGYETTCQSCTCDEGAWNCKKLPCVETCSVEGGSHIRTFDETHYNFHGDCSYVLAKHCTDNSFNIMAELRMCGKTESETCLKSVTVSLKGGDKTFFIKPCGTVLMDMVTTTLPIYSEGISVLQPSASFIIIDTPLGVQIEIELMPLMQARVRLQPHLEGKTCGLCGNFNKNQADDFMTLSGVVEGTGASFANTWKTQSDCPNVKNIHEDPCAASVENERYAEHWCKMLSDPLGPFEPCHAWVQPSEYEKDCMFDTCNNEKTEDSMCAAVSAYVRACAAKGVFMKGWRSEICGKYSEECSETQNYTYSTDTCQATCRSLSEDDATCGTKFIAVDGCVCPEGTYRDENGKCLQAAECSCYHKGSTLAHGETVHENKAMCTCSQGKVNCIGVQPQQPECQAPMVLFDCANVSASSKGSECQKSCQTFDVECGSTYCVSGCMCPEGLVLDGKGNCIKEEACPCLHNEVEYQQGEEISVSCNTCTCKNRKWQCTDKPCFRTCSVYGDGHHTTFDGKRYSFNGDCQYTLAQDYCGNNGNKGNNGITGSTGTFRVITENIPCGTTGTTCSKSLKMFMWGTELILHEAHIDEVVRDSSNEATYKVRNMGIYMVIETTHGMVLTWDRKTNVNIKLNSNFKGKVCGLCGNFDSNGMNDFTTRSQAVVGDVLEFANSWKASPTCPDALEAKDACSANPYRKAWAQKQCSIIKSDSFKSCHSKEDPGKYYEACVTDACACDTGGDCECFCTAVAAYAQACSEVGACTHWRTPTVCPLFCDYYNADGDCEWHYKPCGAPCMKSCANPSGKCLNNLPGLEGCYPSCPEDRPYFDEENMACTASCGCYDKHGNLFRPGDKVYNDENCISCTCVDNEFKCKYDLEACFCEYDHKKYKYNEVIYHTGDSIGDCFVATCEANGTIHREISDCSTSAPPTTFTFTTSSPTSSVTTASVPTTVCVHEVCTWTEWLDHDNPAFGPNDGDDETSDSMEENGKKMCKTPRAVRCRTGKFPNATVVEVNQVKECNDKVESICKETSESEESSCDNYQVSLECCSFVPCGSTTPSTTAPTTSTVTGTTSVTTKGTPETPPQTSTIVATTIGETTIPSTTVVETTEVTTTSKETGTTSSTTGSSTRTEPTTNTGSTSSPSTITSTEPTTSTEKTTHIDTTTTSTTESTTVTKVTTPATTTDTEPTTSTGSTSIVTTTTGTTTGSTIPPSTITSSVPTTTSESTTHIGTTESTTKSTTATETTSPSTTGVTETVTTTGTTGTEHTTTTGSTSSPSTITSTEPTTSAEKTTHIGTSTTSTTESTTVTKVTTPATTTGTEPTTSTGSTSIVTTTTGTTTGSTIPPSTITSTVPTTSTERTTHIGTTTISPSTTESTTVTQSTTTATTTATEPTTSTGSTSIVTTTTGTTTGSTIPPSTITSTVPTTTSESTTHIGTETTSTSTTESSTVTESTTKATTTDTEPTTTTGSTSTVTTTTGAEPGTSTISTTHIITEIPTTPLTTSQTTTVTEPPTTSSHTTVTETTSQGVTTCQPLCQWSQWTDNKKSTLEPGDGDYETYENIIESGKTICEKSEISDVECRTDTNPNTNIDKVNAQLHCNLTQGPECDNADQAQDTMNTCINYQVRFLCCDASHCTTPVTTESTTKSTTVTETTSPSSTGFTETATTTGSTSAPSTTTGTEHTTTTGSTGSPSTITSTEPTTSTEKTTHIGTTTTSTTESTTVTKVTTPATTTGTEPTTSTGSTSIVTTTTGTTTGSTIPPSTITSTVPTTTSESTTHIGTETTSTSTTESSTVTELTTKATTTDTEPTTTTGSTSTVTTTTGAEPGTSTISTTHIITETQTTPLTTSQTTTVTEPPPTSSHTTVTETTSQGVTTCQPLCQWSQWIDNKKSTLEPGDGDYETYENIIESGKTICAKSEISDVECRTETNPNTNIDKVNAQLHCNLTQGPECDNADQAQDTMNTCINYQVRFLCCDASHCTTPVTTESTTTSTTVTETTSPSSTGITETATTTGSTSAPSTTSGTEHTTTSSSTIPPSTITSTVPTTTSESTTHIGTETTSTSTTESSTVTESTTKATTTGTEPTTTTGSTTITETTSPSSTGITETATTTGSTSAPSTTTGTEHTTTTGSTGSPSTITSTVPTTSTERTTHIGTTTTSPTTTETTTVTQSTTPATTTGTETTVSTGSTSIVTTTTGTTTGSTIPPSTITSTVPTTTSESTTHIGTETTTSTSTTESSTVTESTTKATTTDTEPTTTTGSTSTVTTTTGAEPGTTTISTTHIITETPTTPLTTSQTTTVTEPPTTSSHTTVTETTSQGVTACQPLCQWSQWIDNKKSTLEPGDGDYETYENIIESGKTICAKSEISDVECRTETNPNTNIDKLNAQLHCNLTQGPECDNADQAQATKNTCINYQARFLCCDASHCTTPVTTESTTTSTTVTETTSPSSTGITETATTTGSTSAPSTTTGTEHTTTTGSTGSPSTITSTEPTTSTEKTTHIGTTTTSTTESTTVTKVSTPATTTGTEPTTSTGSTSIVTTTTGTTITSTVPTTTSGTETSTSTSTTESSTVTESTTKATTTGTEPPTTTGIASTVTTTTGTEPTTTTGSTSQVVTETTGTSTKHPVTSPETPATWTTTGKTSTTTHTTGETSTSTSTVTTTKCFCSVKGKHFQPGDIIYSVTDKTGCQYYAICTDSCEAEKHQGPCTTSPPPETTIPTSSEITSVTTTPSSPTESTSHTTSPTTTRTPVATTTPTSGVLPTTVHLPTFTIPDGCYQVDPAREVGETWEITKCSNATCEKGGNVTIKHRECPAVKEVTCESGLAPKPVYDKNGCCFHYECESCVGPDGKPRMPGETWPSNCQECTCDTKTITVQCVPMTCQQTQPPTCDEEGYELVEAIVPDNPCCTEMECKCNPRLCIPEVKKCEIGFRLSAIISEGDCCAKMECVPEKVCVYNNITYQPGSEIPQTKGSCKVCDCTEEIDPETKLHSVDCVEISCKTQCSKGYEYTQKSGECCGACEQKACLVKTENDEVKVVKVGDTWSPTGSNCTYYECDEIEGKFITVTVKRTCPALEPEDCAEEDIKTTADGCCKTCKMPQTENCKVHEKPTVLSHGGCNTTVMQSVCEGLCSSSSSFSYLSNTMEHKCSCCQELKTSKKEAQLTCADRSVIGFSYLSVEECGCMGTVCVPQPGTQVVHPDSQTKDSAQQESQQEDSAQQESQQEDSAQQDSQKEDSAQQDSQQKDSAQQDSQKKDSAQQDSQKKDSAQQDTQKKDLAQQESQKNDSAQKDAQQEESAQQESHLEDSHQEDSTQPDSQQEESAQHDSHQEYSTQEDSHEEDSEQESKE